jgi:hypothetical protein
MYLLLDFQFHQFQEFLLDHVLLHHQNHHFYLHQDLNFHHHPHLEKLW